MNKIEERKIMWGKIILIIFGSVIVVVTLSITIGNIIFKRKVNNEMTELFSKSIKSGHKIITEEDIKDLPEPVTINSKFISYNLSSSNSYKISKIQ